jgi:hypothetical protein
VTDEERRRIERDADLDNRVKNLEGDLDELKRGLAWGMRAIWGGVAYLLMQLWTFLSQGGSLK